MELLHLGLIIIGVIVLIVYNLYYKKINIKDVKEEFSMVQSTDLEKKYLKKQDKYWDNRLFPQVVKGGNDDIKFLKFDREKTNLKDDKPTPKLLSPEITKKIERCKVIDKTNECSNIGAYECGYCWETDKIIYGDAKGPIADVCSKKGVGWVPPGPRTNYYCQKKKDRALCGQMKDCGDSTGKKSICAWCPTKGKGVPKKLGPEGGWVAKYPEDICNWKEKLLGEYGTCKDTKTKLPSKLPDRAWHDRDGAYYSCPKYGQAWGSGKTLCDAWKNNYRYQGLGGLEACCVCGGGTKGIDFKDNLIDPKDCKRFGQLFPCVGPNMFTGPHTDACLQNLWGKSGCSGNVKNRVTDRQDYIAWNGGAGSSCANTSAATCAPTNGMSYGNVGTNMKSFASTARSSTNYDKSNAASKKCFGTAVDPCLSRFLREGRPLDCSRKLYAQSGCTIKGELNPEKQKSWPNFYISNTIKNSTLYSSVASYLSTLTNERRSANLGNIQPKNNFDNAITKNMMCYGTKPTIPWTKPCWRDFLIIMTTIPGIQLSSTTARLSFKGAASQFKSLLPITNSASGGWKAKMAWAPNYEVSSSNYQQQYFPFWNFIKTGKGYWNSNWSEFKRLMLLVPSVKTGQALTKSTRWYGWYEGRGGHPGRGRAQAGEGDCDRDSDCGPGLKCGHNKYSIAGIRNTGYPSGGFGGGRDFCYDPNATNFGASGDFLKFTGGSPFDTLIGTSTSLNTANSRGEFYKVGKDRYLSKQAFTHESFPYWHFIRTAEKN